MTKRAPGEGSIRKRANGGWEARITLDSGKRQSFYGRTQRAVKERMVEAISQQQKGTLPDPDKQTLAEYLAVWLEDTAKPTVRPSTYRLYEYAVRVHIAPTAIGKLKLAKVTPQQIQRWLNELSATNLAPKTIKLIHGVLRTALEIASRWNMVTRNTARLVSAPRIPHHEMLALTPEQAGALLKAAEGDRLYALYAVAVALGMRQGEILALRWQDVDLDGSVVTVAHTLQRVDGKAVLQEPKTKSSRRRISIPLSILGILRQHRIRQLEERLLAGQRWQDSGHVFTDLVGGPIGSQRALKDFKRLLVKAGLPDMRFHDLRHTAASLLLAQGVSPRMIMETLGHSNISMTMDTYAHIMPSLRQEAADAMDRILNGLGVSKG